MEDYDGNFVVRRTQLMWLLPLRLTVGWIFLAGGWHKLTGSAPLNGDGLVGILQNWMKISAEQGGAMNDVYARFLQNTVIPHAGVFAALVVWGEILVGATLLLGLVTRWSAFWGMFMTANYLLAAGFTSPSADGINKVFIAACFALLITAARRVLGADFFLARRWSKAPLW